MRRRMGKASVESTILDLMRSGALLSAFSELGMILDHRIAAARVGEAGNAAYAITLAFCDQAVCLHYPASLCPMVDVMFGALRSEGAEAGHGVVVAEDGDGRFSIARDGEVPVSSLTREEISGFLMEQVIWSLTADIAGMLALHAGAVALNGKAILIPGRSGVGKSSLTAWFADKGFDYLSDEITALAGPPAEIAGLPRAIISKEGATGLIAHMAAFRDTASVSHGGSTTAWAVPSIAKSLYKSACRCSLIIFPRYEAGIDLSLHLATQAQAGLGLMECNVNARNLRDDGFAEITALARTVPAVVLRYGDFSQLDGVLDVLSRLLLDGIQDATAARRFLSLLSGKTAAGPPKVAESPKRFPIPAATPRKAPKKLTIGMATYDDYDGVYFTLQALRMYHPEIAYDVEFLVVDNHPDGPCAEPLKGLENHIANYRYVPLKHRRGTAVRDAVFQEAGGDFVLCIDCHVFIAHRGVRRLLDYFEAHPETPDLLQGPLVSDDLDRLVASHMRPEWRDGFFGTWQHDDRARDPDGAPFEIPMQGLGLFACRRAAWPGFNPAFRGFGGEEGYIHEKFRRAGGRTLCLPFLRWLHRFNRPMGCPYANVWDDRVHNYLVGFREVGLPTDGVVEHFRAFLGHDAAGRLFERVAGGLIEAAA
jgi:hypothetical protein